MQLPWADRPSRVAATALDEIGDRREILWHSLTKGVLYDETIHVANCNRALGHAA